MVSLRVGSDHSPSVGDNMAPEPMAPGPTLSGETCLRPPLPRSGVAPLKNQQ
jgi:hypothetical protein